MPLTVKYNILNDSKFDYPFRVFISGSSQSGKTHFARELLLHGQLFRQSVSSVRYYHPDYLSHCPVDWHRNLDIPVSYQSGLPTLAELCELDNNTCVVLDDLYEECVNSQAIDYLFRVLSGKKSISVLILSQRYFSQGKFGLNIRNNCNFTILLRNVDAKLNIRVASLMNLKVAISKAIEDTYDGNYWPYVFIDSSPRGQVSGYRVYTDIFSRFQVTYSSVGMKAYILSEKDFLQYFKTTGKHTAEHYGLHSEEMGDGHSAESDTGKSSVSIKPNIKVISRIRKPLRERARKIRNRRKTGKNLH